MFTDVNWSLALSLLNSGLLMLSTQHSTRPVSLPALASSGHVRADNECFLIRHWTTCSVFFGTVVQVSLSPNGFFLMFTSSCGPRHMSHQHLDQPLQVCLRPVMLLHLAFCLPRQVPDLSASRPPQQHFPGCRYCVNDEESCS